MSEFVDFELRKRRRGLGTVDSEAKKIINEL